jgi:hypothetical protein
MNTLESLRTMEKYLEQQSAAKAYAAAIVAKQKADAKAARKAAERGDDQ